MQIKDADTWAEHLFGHAELNDKRRTQRLVKIATSLATHAGQSLVKASGDEASIEGKFQLITTTSSMSVTVKPICMSLGYRLVCRFCLVVFVYT